MFRGLASVAFASVMFGGVVTPTPAAACQAGYQHDWCVPRVYLGPPVSYGYGNCYVRELWQTPWGPRWRLVNRCP